MANRLFCFGMGYTAQALASGLQATGWAVAGTTRDPSACRELAARGWDIHLFASGRPLDNPPAALAGTTHLLASVPPDESGDAVLAHHAADIAALGGLAWAGYLSTTGVYGDRQGGEVDETSDLVPTSERGRRRAAAEGAWLGLWRDHRIPVHIFRLAGIYGPGRNALETVRQGRARRIRKPGQVFGRIHLDDIVQTLRASMARPNPGAAYNLADDEAAPPDAVIAHACELLGVEPPPLQQFETVKDSLSPMALSFYGENKRVANRRIKQELGVTLKWPTYREGLKGLL
ncbi:MAG: SDR family oxidoreductase [Alphaproteobacteria bacterium]|nr:SDR family oxidoreductase [Alphaproteobacteria bacterium]